MEFPTLLLVVSTLFECTASIHLSEKLFPVIQPSLFPNVPPYIKFKRANDTSSPSAKLSSESETKLQDLLKSLKFGSSLPSIDEIINQTGVHVVSPMENPYKWFGMINACLRKREPEFAIDRILREPFQKYNLLPGSENLAFKKLHHFHTQRAAAKAEATAFNFAIETYALPEEFDKFKAAAKKAGNASWVVKPSNGFNARQVKLFEDWRYISRKTKNSVVQRYIPESDQYKMSINGSRVEIRLNIVVTRFHPLLIYRYGKGVAKVNHKGTSKQVSLEGQSPKYGKFLKGTVVLEEHKKVYEQLWRDQCHMGLLDQRLDDLVIKTLLSAEQSISEASYSTLLNYYNAFQLWTIDVILDKYCKPFLLEVNRYGALAVYNNVTRATTAPLLVDMLNLVGHHFPPYISNSSVAAIRENMIAAGYKSKVDDVITFDERLYTFEESEKDKRKRKKFRAIKNRKKYLNSILEDLLPGDLRYLMQAEDELFRARDFRRLFPTNGTFSYMEYVESDDYFYKLQDAWETKYGRNRNEGIKKLKWHAKFKNHLQTDQKAVQKNKNLPENIVY